MPEDTHTAYLALGSNLGDRLGAMCAAVHALSSHRSIELDLSKDVASLYESDPIGGPPGQGPYLNSVVRVSTTLTPHELLDTVLSIEASLGRTRRDHWEPRVIDIDILLYDDLVINDDHLTVPHPHLHERRFVLDPLAELAGDVVYRGLKLSISELARRARAEAAGQRVTILARSTWPRAPNRLSALL